MAVVPVCHDCSLNARITEAVILAAEGRTVFLAIPGSAASDPLGLIWESEWLLALVLRSAAVGGGKDAALARLWCPCLWKSQALHLYSTFADAI